MNRYGWMAAVAVCAATVGVGAAQTETNRTVTVMGCVQNISSTSPAGETIRGFLLSNVVTNDVAVETPNKAGRRDTSTSYMLEGRSGDLKPQVGHKVEVTGTLSAPAETATGSDSAPSSAGVAGAKSMDRQQRLEVDAVRKVASDCLAK